MQFTLDNKEALGEVTGELSRKGIIPNMYHAALIEFYIFWYFFSTMLTTSVALLYYRKF